MAAGSLLCSPARLRIVGIAPRLARARLEGHRDRAPGEGRALADWARIERTVD